MFRKLTLLSWSAVLALALCACAQAQDSQDHSQDQPSLGDIARQARSQKSTTAPKKVITNDDVSSGSALGGLGFSAAGGANGAANSATSGTPSDDLDKIEGAIAKLDTLDRASLVKLVLQGADVNFPGRPAWEARLVAAKQDYVAQMRDLVREARQLSSMAKTVAASHSGQAPSENDPDLVRLKAGVKQLTENAVHIDAAFQAVVMEGRNRANEVTAH